MIARALIAEGPFNKNVIRGRTDIDDLASRSDADEKLVFPDGLWEGID